MQSRRLWPAAQFERTSTGGGTLSRAMWLYSRRMSSSGLRTPISTMMNGLRCLAFVSLVVVVPVGSCWSADVRLGARRSLPKGTRIVRCASGSLCWAVSDSSMFVTRDGATTWRAELPRGVRFPLLRFGVHGTSMGWMVDASGQIHWTRDQWKSVDIRGSLPGAILSGALRSAWFDRAGQSGWVAGSVVANADSRKRLAAAIFRTVDAGVSWVEVTPRRFRDEGYVPSDAATLFVAGAQSALMLTRYTAAVTQDGGRSWRTVDASPQCSLARVFDAGLAEPIRATFLDGGPVAGAVVGSRNLWVGDSNGYLLATRDGGETWCDAIREPGRTATVRPFETLYFLSATVGVGFGKDQRILVTFDGGKVWNPVGLRGNLVEIVPASREGVALVFDSDMVLMTIH